MRTAGGPTHKVSRGESRERVRSGQERLRLDYKGRDGKGGGGCKGKGEEE